MTSPCYSSPRQPSYRPAIIVAALILIVCLAVCMTAGCSATNVGLTAATATVHRSAIPQSITTAESSDSTRIEVRTPDPVATTPAQPAEPVMQRAVIIAQGDHATVTSPAAAPPQSVEVAIGNQGTIRAPAGSIVVYQVDRRSRDADVASQVDETSTAVGNAISGNAEKMDISKLTPPVVSLAGATGGGAKGISFRALTQSKAAMILMVLGGLLLVAGIVIAIWLKQYVLGIALGIAGIALIGTGVLIQTYPWVFLIPVGLVVVGVIGFVFYARNHGGIVASLKAIVTGVEATSSTTQAEVKTQIAAAASDSDTSSVVKSVVTKLKSALGLNDSTTTAATTATTSADSTATTTTDSTTTTT